MAPSPNKKSSSKLNKSTITGITSSVKPTNKTR